MVEIFIKFFFHFYLLLLLLVPGKFVLCVPVEYDVGSESYDLDTEQSEARYDPRLLSEELRGTHTETQQGAEACISSELRYEHGQKISRTDPCEVCLCVDGEVFCWWKQCESSNQLQTINSSPPDLSSDIQSTVPKPRKLSKLHGSKGKFQSQTSMAGGGTKNKFMKYQSNKNKNKYLNTNYTKKIVNNFPKGILSFPINLPLHIPLSDLDGQQHQQNSTNSNSDVYKLHGHADAGGDDTEITMTTTVTDNSEISTQTPIPTTTGGVSDVTTSNENIPSTIVVVMNETVNPVGAASNAAATTDDDDEYSELQLKHIKIDDITTGQHYVITSSGNVENDDLTMESNVLASDSVISQFNGNKNFADFPIPMPTVLAAAQSQSGLAISTPPETSSLSSLNFTTELSINSVNSNSKLVLNSYSNVKNSNNSNSDSSNISITTDENTTDYDTIIGNVTTTTQEGLLHSSPSSLSPSSSASSSSFVTGTGDGPTTQLISTTTIVTTQMPREENCIVMGITYKIGTILPQETGNCLQCICIEGADPAVDPPRVTCNPHNCPPLILPDLFDTTGY